MSILENTLDGTNMPETNANISNFNIEETDVDTTEIKDSSSSECNVCGMLETISAPSLSRSNYGKDIEDVFSNIDKNFKVVANHDFIKGENGDTIEVEYVNLNKGEIGEKLYEVLSNALFAEDPKKVGGYKWDYDINNYEVPLVVISNIGKKEYIGSATPILFIDYRFSSTVLESVSQDSYIDVTNLSCIVNFKYSNNEWVCEIDKSFPRIQYNKDKKYFEWLLNNEGSTICATGIKGDKGDKLTMHFKDVDINELKNGVFEVPYNNGELINEGDPVLLYLYEKNEDSVNYRGYFIGCVDSVEDKNNIFLVKYNENNVNKIDFAKNTYELFKSLNINNGVDQPAKGIFLPFNNTTNKKAHVIYNDNNNILNIHAVEDYMDFGNPISSKINISVEDIQLNGKLKINKGELNINGGVFKLSSIKPDDLYLELPRTVGLKYVDIYGTDSNNSNYNLIKRNSRSSGDVVQGETGEFSPETGGDEEGDSGDYTVVNGFDFEDYYEFQLAGGAQGKGLIVDYDELSSSNTGVTGVSNNVLRIKLTNEGGVTPTTCNVAIKSLPKSSLSYFALSVENNIGTGNNITLSLYNCYEESNIDFNNNVIIIHDFYSKIDILNIPSTFNVPFAPPTDIMCTVVTDNRGDVILSNCHVIDWGHPMYGVDWSSI